MSVRDQDGNRVTAATIETTPVTDDNPPVRIDQDLFRTRRTGPLDDKPEGSIKTLLCRAGHVVNQSTLDVWFGPSAITGVTPAEGPAAGGTVVTITGNRLDAVTEVRFGATAGTNLKIVSDTELTVTTPAGVAGDVDIEVDDDSGVSTETDGFTYE